MNFISARDVNFVNGEFSISLKYRNEISDILDIFGDKVRTVNTKEPTLEDVFIQTVKVK